MDILLTLLILAVGVGLVYWAASVIPFPAQLMFLRWLLPLIALIAALIYVWPRFGVT